MVVRRHNSLSFNYAKSYFYQPMVYAIVGVTKPHLTMHFRGNYLDEELECVKAQLESIKSSWNSTGCTIMSYGWINLISRTLINFVVAFPKGTMFLRSIDASAHVKDAHLIFTLLVGIVEEVGVANVVQVITDNWRVALCQISHHFLDFVRFPLHRIDTRGHREVGVGARCCAIVQ